jgi:hypothetical protein
MGIYINPLNMTKEEWLAKNAVSCGSTPPAFPCDNETLPVCLIDNVIFTAAGVAYSPNELQVFSDPQDGRFKLWYLAKIEDLATVSDLKRVLK